MRAVLVTGPSPADWICQLDFNGGDLATLQKVVGGYIEALPIDSDKATVWMNEEGRLNNLPINTYWTKEDGTLIDSLHGPLVILGPVDAEGDTTELTDEALAYVRTVVKPANRMGEGPIVSRGDSCTRCGGSGYEPI